MVGLADPAGLPLPGSAESLCVLFKPNQPIQGPTPAASFMGLSGSGPLCTCPPALVTHRARCRATRGSPSVPEPPGRFKVTHRKSAFPVSRGFFPTETTVTVLAHFLPPSVSRLTLVLPPAPPPPVWPLQCGLPPSLRIYEEQATLINGNHLPNCRPRCTSVFLSIRSIPKHLF